jgi:hypothetical protein
MALALKWITFTAIIARQDKIRAALHAAFGHAYWILGHSFGLGILAGKAALSPLDQSAKLSPVIPVIYG